MPLGAELVLTEAPQGSPLMVCGLSKVHVQPLRSRMRAGCRRLWDWVLVLGRVLVLEWGLERVLDQDLPD